MNQKILLIGNETEDTDIIASKLALKDNSSNHGLVNDVEFHPIEYGYYHTSVVDLNEGKIKKVSGRYDLIVMLDQPQDSYPHFKNFLRTFRLFKNLEEQNINVEYQKNQNIKKIDFWWNYLRENYSFCYYPFTALVPDTEYTRICPKNSVDVKLPSEIKDWRSDPDYRVFRDKMLAGEKLDSKYCHECYDKQDRGLESARMVETLEWACRLKFSSPDEFDQLSDPISYEIRPSNLCNIMCRMCGDEFSHLIEREKKSLGLPMTPWRFSDYPVEKINLDTAERIYFAGGEPTIMPEFLHFLKKCVSLGKTDFELNIGTNGMRYSKELISLLRNFSKVTFSISFDGFGKVNDYIRWKSDFNTIVENSRIARDEGHTIGLQTVIQMYNVTRIHEIFEFYDDEYPNCASLVQVPDVHNDDLFRGNCLLPWSHPRADLVVESMERCMRTNQYMLPGRSVTTYVNKLHQHYNDPNYRYDPILLKKFFEYNDTLDQKRNSRLGDYIPELEECRHLIV